VAIASNELRSYAAAASLLESQNATSVADGATIERRIRISQPDEGSKNAPSLQGLSHAGVARSRRRRMISTVKPDEPASNFQQRDNA
jgi:hypothetical protein